MAASACSFICAGSLEKGNADLGCSAPVLRLDSSWTALGTSMVLVVLPWPTGSVRALVDAGGNGSAEVEPPRAGMTNGDTTWPTSGRVGGCDDTAVLVLVEWGANPVLVGLSA